MDQTSYSVLIEPFLRNPEVGEELEEGIEPRPLKRTPKEIYQRADSTGIEFSTFWLRPKEEKPKSFRMTFMD